MVSLFDLKHRYFSLYRGITYEKEFKIHSFYKDLIYKTFIYKKYGSVVLFYKNHESSVV